MALAPLTRDIYLVCVESNPETDTCDAKVQTNCIDRKAKNKMIHVELLITIPCLGTPERCLTTTLPYNTHDPTHRMPKLHLASFRVVRSTFWSALPPFLSWILSILLVPFFALLSLFSGCKNCFPCTREKMKNGNVECYFGGVSEEDRRQFRGGVQMSLDREFRAADRFSFYRITNVSEAQRERIFAFLLAQAPDAPLTDAYDCGKGYNYRLWACLPLCCCCPKPCCCIPGARAVDYEWRPDPESPETEEAELNRASGEAADSGDRRERDPLVGAVQKMRAKYPRANWICSEMVAAALVVGGVLQGLDPCDATPATLYQALEDSKRLESVLIDQVKGLMGGREGGRSLPPLPPPRVAPMEVEGAGLPPPKKKAKKGKTIEEEADELLG